MMRLLLISNSGRPHFQHCRDAIRDFAGPAATIGFVAAAGVADDDGYFRLARDRLLEDGSARRVVNVDWREQTDDLLDEVDAVFVGGGNTYALTERLHASGLDEVIAARVRDGLPYLGVSAGANVAGPNILTTNDWNVVGTTRFEGLSFVTWNINPHYAAEASEAPTAERREDRIREYHAVRHNSVVAMEEGAMVEVLDGIAWARGTARSRVFTPHEPPRWVEPGDRLGELTTDRDGAAGELRPAVARQTPF